ncbi:Methyltransferase domain-containing protein [Eubacterium ruminantium]|nr:Methyltransferase domain-containing protein [Eubacterium ruminantium]
MENTYSKFAYVYDKLMDNIPYDEWTSYLTGILRRNGINDGIVAELGCGTGNITERLAKEGYDMIGIDNSPEMLDIAQQKKDETGSSTLYICQDMREFELYGTVRAVVSLCDSINYILEEEDLLQVFKLVNNYLDPKGLFIFDFNSLHYYRDIVADNTIAEDRDETSFIWDNYFDEESRINELSLALFIKETNDDDNIYRKYSELHLQRAYTLEEIKHLIELSGMEFVADFNAFTDDPSDERSERIYVIAREHGKKPE